MSEEKELATDHERSASESPHIVVDPSSQEGLKGLLDDCVCDRPRSSILKDPQTSSGSLSYDSSTPSQVGLAEHQRRFGAELDASETRAGAGRRCLTPTPSSMSSISPTELLERHRPSVSPVSATHHTSSSSQISNLSLGQMRANSGMPSLMPPGPRFQAHSTKPLGYMMKRVCCECGSTPVSQAAALHSHVQSVPLHPASYQPEAMYNQISSFSLGFDAYGKPVLYKRLDNLLGRNDHSQSAYNLPYKIQKFNTPLCLHWGTVLRISRHIAFRDSTGTC